ncbi:NUDIX domain-containing protein [Streptomyces sp. NPDC048644]|uniref:NUDIX domain-containing protein n=1 Tax=Streptomyces sp. NPDC048644 TaxID=3365582 RepID=UPI0037132E62
MGTTAHLCGGNHTGEVPPLDRHQVLPRLRPGHSRPWHTTPAPDGMQIAQAWGWLFAPDGRVVVVVDPQKRWPMLPGGTVEPTDLSPEDTLRREATEEAQVTIGGDITRLGWVHDATGEVYGGIGECARLRLAAPLTTVGPAAVDPATGRQFARLLAPQQTAGLIGWGQQGYIHAALVEKIAHQRWGIPYAAPSPITELREPR